MANLYNSEGYFSPTEYAALTRIEKDERAARIAANYRPLVYICSPYSEDTDHNTEMAKKYSRFALEQHCIPFAPHLLFPQFMNDNDPKERETAIFMNMVLLGRCEELWVFGENYSAGIQQEIRKAKHKRMKIRYFTEEMEERV